jgi:hypothetical protein
MCKLDQYKRACMLFAHTWAHDTKPIEMGLRLSELVLILSRILYTSTPVAEASRVGEPQL